MEALNIDGWELQGADIPLYGTCHLLVVRAEKGMLGCGYLSLGAAEKFGHALAIVRGVSNYGEMLDAKVQEVSAAAASLGVKSGMTGREALALMS